MSSRSRDDTARPGDEGPLDAGDLGSWLGEVRAAIAGEGASEVPCGACTACCRASQFVHIEPDETDALAHIPSALTFPAPGLPRGHVLLGYDERGHCPMLVDGACSIYAHRPRTCRTYDCRVFAATDVAPDGTKVEIAGRVSRWRFSIASEDDRARLAAVRAAAALVQSPPAALAARDVTLPRDPTQQAVLAVEIHETFLTQRDGRLEIVDPDLGAVADAVGRVRARQRAR